MQHKQIQLEVSGMKCGGCVARAREALDKLPGVEACEFDLGAGRASVSGSADPQAVAAALTAIGYPAKPA